MNMKNKLLISILFFIVLFTSCNEGLAPAGPVPKSYLKGLITYVGGKDKWTKDSVYAIRVAAFKNYPFLDTNNIMLEILSGQAYFTLEPLPKRVDTAGFSLEIPDSPREIKYIGVAMQYDSSLFSQRVIGIYTETGDRTKPSAIFIEKGKSAFVNLIVNWDSLPPQPIK
jgi:hypothetical protein